MSDPVVMPSDEDMLAAFHAGTPSAANTPDDLMKAVFNGAKLSVADRARLSLASRGLTPEAVKAGGGVTQPEDIKFAPPTGGGPGAYASAALHAIPAALEGPGAALFSPARAYASGRAPTTEENLNAGTLGMVPPFVQTAQEAMRRGAANESTDPMYGSVAGGTALAAAAPLVPKAIEGVGDAAGATRTAITESVPNRMANSAIGATRKYFRFGNNPGAAVQRIVYNSIDELPGKLDSQEIIPKSNKLQSILRTDAAQTKVIDVDANIRHAFNQAIEKAQRDNNASLENTLNDRMAGRIAAAHELTKGARYTGPDLAYKVMQQLGDDTKWTNDPVEGTVENAKQDAYRNINAAIDTAIPAAVPLTRDIANALTAKKAVQAQIETGQATHPFIGALNTLRRVGGVLGGIGGAIAGHPEAGAAGAAMAFAPDVLSAAPVTSRISALLSSMGRGGGPLPETMPSPVFPQPSSQGLLPPYPQRMLPPYEPRMLPPSDAAPPSNRMLPAAPEAPSGVITTNNRMINGAQNPIAGFPFKTGRQLLLEQYTEALRQMGLEIPR